jgi:hypothetical protein
MHEQLDHRVYPERRRWHYTILQRLADGGGRSMPIYDSQAETDDGFATYEEAQSAAALKTRELTTTVEAMKE